MSAIRSLYSGSYLTLSNSYIGFPYHLLVRPKRHGTACAIGPKGKARTHGPPMHWDLLFWKLSTWVRFNYPPRLGPKSTEPCVLLVPKVKLGHTDCMPISPKFEARTHRLHAPSVPKVKLGHTDRVHHWSQR